MPHKLLLADDSVTIQRVIELTFADEDVHVIAVGDGKQAIDRVQQEHPDIVLADIGMPERDGYEVASFIKNTPQLAHIPVLLLTGAFEPIDENRARSVGCDGVLVKPFEPQMVINRVRDLLAGRRPAGLWASSPTAQTPVRPPAGAGESDVRGAAGGSTAAGRGNDALEEYFDRLDAAFAGPDKPAAPAPAPAPAPIPISVSSPPPQHPGFGEPPPPGGQPPPPPVNISEWDPHLPGDAPAASRPAPIPVAGTQVGDASSAAATASPSPAAPAAPPSVAEQAQQPASAPASAAVPQMPPLADAFAALLAAEQGQPIVPSPHRIGSLSDDQLDEIARRVIDRMSDQSMRRAVLDAAERLVREEIERIKSKSR